MSVLDQLLQKQQEFQTFLHNINIDELKVHSRAELQQHLEKKREIEERHIHSEIRDLIQQKKFEEYPELLSVHHFPELKEIDFLTEEQLVVLDNKLASRPLHQVIALTGTAAPWGYHERIYEFLLKKGIIARYIHVKCPYCIDGTRLSGSFDEKYKDQWLADLKASYEAGEAVGLLTQSEFDFGRCCEGCDEFYSIEEGGLDESFFEDLRFGDFFVMAKERDKRWDNI